MESNRRNFHFDGHIYFHGLTPEIEERCPLLGRQRFAVAEKVANWVKILEDDNLLPDMWRREGYPRSYCETHGLSPDFKDAEDAGDRRMREFVVTFFDACVAKQQEKVVDYDGLMALLEQREKLHHVPVMLRAENASDASMFPYHTLPSENGLDSHVIVFKATGNKLKTLLSSTPARPIQGFSFDQARGQLTYSWGLSDLMQFQTREDKNKLPAGIYQIQSMQHLKSKDIFGKDFSVRQVEGYEMDENWMVSMRLLTKTVLCAQTIHFLKEYTPQKEEKFIVTSMGRDVYDYLWESRSKYGVLSDVQDGNWLKPAMRWYQANVRGAFTEASNWTVSLCYCADLLGLDQPGMDDKREWRAAFGHQFPVRLPVRYLPPSWKMWHKKEANMYECLVGLLFQQDNDVCLALAKMLTFLSILCVIFPPRNVPPSNRAVSNYWDEREIRRPIASEELSNIPNMISLDAVHSWLLEHARNLAKLEETHLLKREVIQEEPCENRQLRGNPAASSTSYPSRPQPQPAKFARLDTARPQIPTPRATCEGLSWDEVEWQTWNEEKGMYWCLACKKYITDGHLASQRHLNHKHWYIKEKVQESRPLPSWVILKNGDWRFCTLCNVFITDSHLKSKTHIDRLERWKATPGNEAEPSLYESEPSVTPGSNVSSDDRMEFGAEQNIDEDDDGSVSSGSCEDYYGFGPQSGPLIRTPRPY